MRTPTRLLTTFAIAVSLAACPSDPDPQPDAGTDEDADADFEIALPVLTPCPEGWEEVPPEEEGRVTTCDPWPGSSPVDMTPCPNGWREVEDDGVVTCDPWPEGGPHECADDEAHFPGEPGCSLIGTPCPEGNWAEGLPEDAAILYVLAGAPAGGEGTQDSPFGSINEALDVAEEGTIVAPSKGTFDEAVRLRNGITVWGACVAETSVWCSATSLESGTVSIIGRDAVVRNLRIGGRRIGVSLVSSSNSAQLNDVLIAGARTFGVLATGGSLNLHSVVVRDTQPQPTDGQWGRGLHVQDGAQVEASRAVFERNREIGVAVNLAGSTLSLIDVAVRDTLFQESDNLLGRGLTVENGAQAEVRRSVFERNREAGIVAYLPETNLSLTYVVVRDTQPQESDDLLGRGLSVENGAHAEVRRSIFERNRDFGVGALGPGSTLDVSDVVVRDTRSEELHHEFGRGLTVVDGAHAEVRRSVFERNREVGVRASLAGTTLILSDVLVRDTQPQEIDGLFGSGLSITAGAHVELSGSVFERNHAVGIAAMGTDTTLSLMDSLVRDTQCQDANGLYGSGLTVGNGAHAEVNRTVFARNHEAGVLVGGEQARANLSDVLVLETLEGECTEAVSCSTFGDGIVAYEGATITMTDFVVSENAR